MLSISPRFDQVTFCPAWVGIETAIFWQCSPGTLETQRLCQLRLKDSAFLSDVAVYHLKTVRGEIWPKRSEKNNKSYQNEDKSPQ